MQFSVVVVVVVVVVVAVAAAAAAAACVSECLLPDRVCRMFLTLRKCREEIGGGRPFCIMNTTQASARSPAATLMPALIKNSMMYSSQHQRILTLAEMLQVQGYPIFEDNCPYICPLAACCK